jgi:drug/metabolite transporter (DMT)-like permease
MVRNGALLRLMPWVFVLIWSTGFVVARYGMAHAPPMTFLSIRYALSVVCFAIWIRLAHAAWPTERAQWWHLGVSGVLMHAGYLGGVWAAVKGGIGAGTVALLVGLQPVLTALWISATASRVTKRAPVEGRQWAGLMLGLCDLALVVWPKLGAGEVTPLNLMLGTLALFSITAGTLYQKRYVTPTDVRTANAIQLIAALAVSLPFAGLETEAVRWHAQMVGALAWSVLVLTLGGSSLLYLLIQRGAATRVTSLLYLVPPCTATMAWWLFGEAMSAPMLAGMALAIAGVALVMQTPKAAQ